MTSSKWVQADSPATTPQRAQCMWKVTSMLSVSISLTEHLQLKKWKKFKKKVQCLVEQYQSKLLLAFRLLSCFSLFDGSLSLS